MLLWQKYIHSSLPSKILRPHKKNECNITRSLLDSVSSNKGKSLKWVRQNLSDIEELKIIHQKRLNLNAKPLMQIFT